MSPPTSRVKLNRAALKDVFGLKVVKRRRQPAASLNNNTLTFDPTKQEEEPEKDTSSPRSSSEPGQTVSLERLGPESVSHTASSIVGVEQEGFAGAYKTKRRSQVRSRKVDSVEFGQKWPCTKDIDRNIQPSPTGLVGSEKSLRRAGRACTCGLFADCKYLYPQWKKLGKQGLKSSSPGPEQPMVKVKIKNKNTVTETSQKISVWIDRYPKVTLCDIAKKCHGFSHNCGYTLLDFLKNKAVHCFKQETRAGFRFVLGCLGADKHRNEDGALAQNREVFPGFQCEKSVCQSQHSSENQGHLKERTDAQTLSSHTTCRFPASFLTDKHTKKVECKTGMWDTDVEGDLASGSRLAGAGGCIDKRIKLGDGVKDWTLPSHLDPQSVSCKSRAKTESGDKEKTCSRMTSDYRSCSEHAHGGSSTLGSALKENCVLAEPCGEIYSPTKTDAEQMSSELLSERTEVDTGELDSFTCQRVRVYLRKSHCSCARTYMSWPFSNRDRMLTAQTDPSEHPAEPLEPSENSDCPINQNQPSSPSFRTNDVLSNGPPDTASQFCQQNEEKVEEDGKRKGETYITSYSSEIKNIEGPPHLMETEESLASPPSGAAKPSSLSQCGKHPGTDALASPLLVKRPQTSSSTSTPSPSALGLIDWDTATSLSSMSSPFMHSSLNSLSAAPSPLPPSTFQLSKVRNVCASSPNHAIKAVEETLFCSETRMTSCSFSPSSPPHSSDSIQSCDSSLLLLQDEQERDEELLLARSPPKLEPCHNTSPINSDLLNMSLCNVFTEKYVETDFILPSMLSPVTSPQGCLRTSFLLQSSGSSDEDEENDINKGAWKYKMVPGCNMPQIGNSDNENSSPSSDEDVDDGNEERRRAETDNNNDVEQDKTKSERDPPDPRIKALSSGVLAEPCSSPSSDADDGEAFSGKGWAHSPTDEQSLLSEMVGSGRDYSKAQAAAKAQQGILDECSAYEQDILLINVIQDDPELFENLPQGSVLKLGPNRVSETPKTRPVSAVNTLLPGVDGASQKFEQRLTPVYINFHNTSPDITEESNRRPWRPQCQATPPKTGRQTKTVGQPDANNNHGNGPSERNQPIQTVNSLNNNILPLMTTKHGPWMTNPPSVAEFRRQKSNSYCRQYFSESLSCGFKMCRFQHVPVEGDEKFCVETVARFTKNPTCLQKAGAVYTGYYQNNPPGVYFSMPVFLSLLWALLRAGMVSDIFSVLTVSLAHKIVPDHEFLLALFNSVRERSLMGYVPELMQLTYKMASAGLVLSLDCLDCVKNTPEVQQTVCPNPLAPGSGSHKVSTSTPSPEYLNLAHAIVEIELCTKTEDWRRMGEVFRFICQLNQRPNQVEQTSGRIAIALLSESKDKLSLPFAAFAETVCQSEGEDGLSRSFLGRIGVSLMLRYHKTHQWAKGRRVVEVLSISKINYSTLRGLFGNEDGVSRCHLVTVATELFLLSGSVEGALNTLRENKWFVSSCSWPCEPADLQSRTRVLMRLAEKTSHRDTLDVLCNLPGLKEPNDLIDISRYHPLFNSHLQACVDKQMLPVASDTLDFMLSKNLAVDPVMLQILLHKLAKQNCWLRAREVFRHSLRMGYYADVCAPPGLMALMVPCQLGEVEMALAFEMFITVNATAVRQLSEITPYCLSITLKRTQSCESEYLSAGSRLLSAACILQPKLIIHYTAVNSSQEQMFTLDIPSARCWLRHNHLWASEVWTH